MSMIGVSEAINLGIRLGLEPEMIAQVINTSSGRCWSSDTYNPCPAIIEGIPSSNNYQGGFASQLMTKVSRDLLLSARWLPPLRINKVKVKDDFLANLFSGHVHQFI